MQNYSQFTDEQLMQQFKLGDEMACMVLYERYESRVYGFLRKKLGTTQIVDDIFQQSFLNLCSKKNNYKEQSPFANWFFTVVHNSMIDHLRKSSTQLKLKSQIKEQHSSNENCTGKDLIDISHLLDRLSEKEKNLIQSRFHHDKSFTEISSEHNVSVVNARKIVSRAINKLRKLARSES